MGMSYRKAWLLVQEMQDTFNGAVVTTEIGGSDGGGTKLTELGTNLLKTYRRIENRAPASGGGRSGRPGGAGESQCAAAPVWPPRQNRLKRSRAQRYRKLSRPVGS